MSQFNTAALEVYNVDHAFALAAMKSSLWTCPFLFSLEKTASTDFFEMLAKVEKMHAPRKLMKHMAHLPVQ